MLFTVEKDYFSLWFTCNRKLNTLQTFTEKGWKDLEEKGIAKKVVTNGNHLSYPTGSEFCPICKMMHQIAQSGYRWEDLPLRLKEALYWMFTYKFKSFFKVLKVKIADAKYGKNKN